MVKLGVEPLLDYKLSYIIRTSPVTFAAFGVPTLINYFRQFYPNYEFLKYVPRILDARIMYHKIQRKGQRSFATIYQILFSKRLDMSEQFSNWEQRPLTMNQMVQTGVETQSLLNMVYKLSHLSITKDKRELRLYLCNLVSSVINYIFIDNPSVPNKFETSDMKVKHVGPSKKNKKNNIFLLKKANKQNVLANDRITKIIYNYYQKLYEEKRKVQPQQPPAVGVADPCVFYPIATPASEHEERQKR